MRLTSLAILLCLVACGCSNKIQLSGKVTYADDGAPLTAGIVCFETDGYLARGHLKADGSYRISSTGRDDGLPKGKYKVYIVDAMLVSPGKGGNFIYTPLIDKRYDSAIGTDLECDVDAKTRRFDFKVVRAVGKK